MVWVALPFDQANVSGAGTLRGFLDREFHALSLTKKLEDRRPNGAAVKEVFGAALIANESESLVDE
jgi:hypothetical protein